MNVGLISGTDGSFTTTAKNGSEQKSMTVSYKGTNTTDPYDCANPNSNYLCVTFQNTDGTDWRSLKIAGNNSINLACGEMKGSNLPSSSAAVSAEYTSR